MAGSARYKVVFVPPDRPPVGDGAGLGLARDPEYLFDLVPDPAEKENLAGDEILEAAWLEVRFRAWIESGKVAETASRSPR